MSAAAIFASEMMMSRKRIIRQLRDLNAFEASSAAPLQLKSAFDRDVMKSLMKKGVVIAPEQARYYLDRDAHRALEDSEARQVRGFLIAVCIITVIAIVIYVIRR